ncbi:1,4-alpha-glucan branching protein [Streptomyces sp. NPDC050418]|uniref:maltokinase N-terminal cap-like domain-containing protein n=1 Tax=Streptomyces sp. NPDC050418 TaxID=3365612 RepID=UPI0037931D41
MAEIHQTTLTPTKTELLAEWLPGRPWYRGGTEAPELTKAGGFRLDDPAGEVGIEFMVVGTADAAYLTPMTYRGAPLDGAEDALIGTSEHGVLGKRRLYDGAHDPVLVAELAALFEGRATAQAQNVSDQEDREVEVVRADGPLGAARIAAVTDTEAGTEIRLTGGAVLRLARALAPGDAAGSDGHVSAVWKLADGTEARAPFVTLHLNA